MPKWVKEYSHSEIQAFRDCPRKYRLKYEDCVTKAVTPHFFVAGRAAHAFIEAFHEGIELGPALTKIDKHFNEADTSLMTPDQVKTHAIEHARIRGMCQAYMHQYADDARKYPKFICEVRETIPIFKDKGIGYKGYIDTLLRDQHGDWWIKEVKTASKSVIGPGYYDRIKIDSQTLGYMMLARQKLGVFPKGLIYDVMVKTAHRQKAGESIQQFCRRIYNLYREQGKSEHLMERTEIMIDHNEVRNWLADLKETIRTMEFLRSKGTRWPRNDGHCLGKYYPCDMLQACANGDRFNTTMYQVDEHRAEVKAKREKNVSRISG